MVRAELYIRFESLFQIGPIYHQIMVHVENAGSSELQGFSFCEMFICPYYSWRPVVLWFCKVLICPFYSWRLMVLILQGVNLSILLLKAGGSLILQGINLSILFLKTNGSLIPKGVNVSILFLTADGLNTFGVLKPIQDVHVLCLWWNLPYVIYVGALWAVAVAITSG